MKQILILTSNTDIHAHVVADHLIGYDVVIGNTADLPQYSFMTGTLPTSRNTWNIEWATNNKTINSDKLIGVWLRRPERFTTDNDASPGVIEFCLNEARIGFGGLMSTWPWLNHPFAIAEAEYKPRQLQAATTHGLHVPPTIITNSYDDADRFITKHGPEVAMKPFTQGAVDLDGESAVLYTIKLTQKLLTANITKTAHLLQKWVTGTNIRATIVDNNIYAATVTPTTDAGHTDYRQEDWENLTLKHIDLPPAIQKNLVAVNQSLGLRFCTADLIKDHKGRYWFIDLNPNGQWLWVEEATGAPIAKAIANALTNTKAPDQA